MAGEFDRHNRRRKQVQPGLFMTGLLRRLHAPHLRGFAPGGVGRRHLLLMMVSGSLVSFSTGVLAATG